MNACESLDLRSSLRVFSGDDSRYVAIVGSRNYPRMHLVRHRVEKLKRLIPGVVIVSGTEPGARKGRGGRTLLGVDETAILAADRLGLSTLVCEPDWDAYGRAAGPKRNRVLVEQCDDLVAYWDLRSRGTAHTILMAAEVGKLRSVFGPQGELIEPDDAVLLAMDVVG